jgi:hypothetical protein
VYRAYARRKGLGRSVDCRELPGLVRGLFLRCGMSVSDADEPEITGLACDGIRVDTSESGSGS